VTVIFDEASTADMRGALATALGLTGEIHQAVVAAHGSTIWTGQAADTFTGSVEIWLREFGNLREALGDLDRAMGQYAVGSGDAETIARGLGVDWAGPV